ncbi:hypothetical protein E2C01_057685 [Portunus trituberculatus]|uniref:Uncharacterized protein n=1 Tax=Portunus trituberculatus TaxID=210409 RepID=A0A5B7H161_PORTR|nr:hypothetical protein [Portunus trituberculatus]
MINERAGDDGELEPRYDEEEGKEERRGNFQRVSLFKNTSASRVTRAFLPSLRLRRRGEGKLVCQKRRESGGERSSH